MSKVKSSDSNRNTEFKAILGSIQKDVQSLIVGQTNHTKELVDIRKDVQTLITGQTTHSRDIKSLIDGQATHTKEIKLIADGQANHSQVLFNLTKEVRVLAENQSVMNNRLNMVFERAGRQEENIALIKSDVRVIKSDVSDIKITLASHGKRLTHLEAVSR